jgi:hypothetical protein
MKNFSVVKQRIHTDIMSIDAGFSQSEDLNGLKVIGY